MYHHPANAKGSRRDVSSPPPRTIVGMGLTAVVPVAVVLALSYPDFAVGILAGGVLSYAIGTVRHLSNRLARYDPGTVLRALRPDRLLVTRKGRFQTDR